jgi:transcriptional regulator with GAF, ATPase, and Fis domain
MRQEHLSERMTAAARELQEQHDPAATVKNAVELLVRNVEGCDTASVSLVHAKRRVDTPAASDTLATTCDRLQQELGEGPCLDAIWEDETVYVPNLATDLRWPNWAHQVTEATGVRSVLTFRLFTIQDILGALSMYSTKADAFSAEDKAEGWALAAQIAIAVAAAQRLEQYETALDSRTVTAQACGLVMERYNIDAVRAFAVLTRISQTQNIKLRAVAAELVLTRHLPTTPASDPDD